MTDRLSVPLYTTSDRFMPVDPVPHCAAWYGQKEQLGTTPSLRDAVQS
jgi:hypothetical protein